MSNMTPKKKIFLTSFLMLISLLFNFFNLVGNLIYKLPNKGSKVEMFMYWEWMFSIIPPDS